MVLKESYDINSLKPPESPLIMLDVQHIKCLEQYAPRLFMFDIQHIIGLEQHIELPDPLPLTRDKEDEDNSIYIQTIYIKALNNIYFNPHPQSYSFHSYKPKNRLDLLPMSPYSKICDSTESFICRV